MILLDWTILISLIITITYCWKLNNKISELKKGRKELQELISNFDNFIEKTQLNIEELRKLSNKTTSIINEKFDKAKLLADDLSFMTDRATNLADKLEKLISFGRKIEGSNIEKVVNESSIEKQYGKKSNVHHEFKKSTIESLLEKIASVKDNHKKYSSVSQAVKFLEKKYPEEV